MRTDKEEVQKILNKFSPEQQQLAQSIATMRIENKMLKQQIADLKGAYDELWKVMIVILHAQPENELRIHESQFLRFKEEYRIDRSVDEDMKELVLKLKTLREE